VQDYALFLLDAEGQIVAWYAGAERRYGYKGGEVIGQHVSLFYPDEDALRKLREKLKRAAGRQRPQAIEGCAWRTPGTEFQRDEARKELHKPVVRLTCGGGPASSRPTVDAEVRSGIGVPCLAARSPSKNISVNAIRITTTAIIDKTETYIKNAPVLPRRRIPERTKMILCMSLAEADWMPPSRGLAIANAFSGQSLRRGPHRSLPRRIVHPPRTSQTITTITIMVPTTPNRRRFLP
jgi:PAS domain S-box-containing protein